jgi:hypothetical protein
MQRLFVLPALFFAGYATAQDGGRANPLDPGAKSPVVQYRSAFEGYKPFADQELSDWRKANAEVGAAGQKTSKPVPAKPSGHQGHGARK